MVKFEILPEDSQVLNHDADLTPEQKRTRGIRVSKDNSRPFLKNDQDFYCNNFDKETGQVIDTYDYEPIKSENIIRVVTVDDRMIPVYSCHNIIHLYEFLQNQMRKGLPRSDPLYGGVFSIDDLAKIGRKYRIVTASIPVPVQLRGIIRGPLVIDKMESEEEGDYSKNFLLGFNPQLLKPHDLTNFLKIVEPLGDEIEDELLQKGFEQVRVSVDLKNLLFSGPEEHQTVVERPVDPSLTVKIIEFLRDINFPLYDVYNYDVEYLK
jgi:hypothetical protein